MLYKKTEKLSIIKREGEIMGMFVNPNAAAFQCAVNSEVYIDKTGLLEYTNKVLGTNARFICNSRPRRFGKSVTVDMLTAYYSKGCVTLCSSMNCSRSSGGKANSAKALEAPKSANAGRFEHSR